MKDIEENMITFSEKEPPLYFLIAMGFSFDKASMYVKDKALNGRLLTAIKEVISTHYYYYYYYYYYCI